MKRRKPKPYKSRSKPKKSHKPVFANVQWADRYDYDAYRQNCAIAHSQTKSRCVVCLSRRSEIIHHTRYLGEGDRPGVNLFPTCQRCHKHICHSAHNWVFDFKDPLWGNHNTISFERRLQVSYQLLKGKKA